jgi:energy-converting hydrogenase Eha subunit G
MNILKRAQAPTPKFFKVLRNIGVAMLAISGSIFAAAIVLPSIVVTVAGYVAVAGSVLSAVSQITVSDDEKSGADNPLQNESRPVP